LRLILSVVGVVAAVCLNMLDVKEKLHTTIMKMLIYLIFSPEGKAEQSCSERLPRLPQDVTIKHALSQEQGNRAKFAH
jgi:hypothetical protein